MTEQPKADELEPEQEYPSCPWPRCKFLEGFVTEQPAMLLSPLAREGDR